MLLAVGSEKSTVENEQDILFAFKTFQADFIPFEIGQREIGCGLVEFGAAHAGSTKIIPNMISTTRLMIFERTTDLSANMEIPRTIAIPR